MNIKIYAVLTVLVCWLCIDIYGQNYTELPEFKKANSWYMFKSPYLDMTTFTQPTFIADFNESPPEFHTVPLFENVAYATVADRVSGDLLFYSDGKTIWNSEFEPMPNGTGLAGDGFARQGVCIVAKVNDPDKYYVFSIPSVPFGGATVCDLHYSVVDMALDDGKGDVVEDQKNILLDEGPVGEMMIAVPGNQCDVWLIVHPYSEPVFKAYHITEEGVNPEPVLSYTDSIIYGPGAYVSGCMAVSPDRSKIALASNGKLVCFAMGYMSADAGGTMLAEFDATTGTIFNDIKLNDSAAYGIAFSNDGSKLYATDMSAHMAIYDDSDTGRVYQYEVGDYPATWSLVHTDMLIGSWPVQQLRMMPDGQLLANTFLYYTDPDETGLDAGLDTNRYDWWPEGLIGSIGLGNEMIFALPPDTSQATLDTFFCKGDGLQLTTRLPGHLYLWEDGSTDSARSISTPGKYWVSYLHDRCNVAVDTFIVSEYNPSVNLGSDVVICDSSGYTLIPVTEEENVDLIWFDGSNGASALITQGGIYWVEASTNGCFDRDTINAILFPGISGILGEDVSICKGMPIAVPISIPEYSNVQIGWSTGASTNAVIVYDTGTYSVSVSMPPCFGEDTVKVKLELCECNFDVPSAFSPNQDGLNDYFKIALEPDCEVSGFMLSVFDRFGKRIFVGWSPQDGWDGTLNGTPLNTGVYMYEVHFYGGTKRIPYTRKGDITLIK